MGRTRSMHARAVVVAAGIALLASSVSAAAVPPDESARGKEWVAIGSAYGAASGSEQGVTVDWSGAVLAAFRFTVDDAGLAAGEWSLAGNGTQTVEGSGFSAVGDLTYSGGGGVGGDESTLVATGSATTTGTVQPMGIEVNNTNALPPLAIDVEVFCGEMWGTWELTVADAFEDAGFDTSFDGTLVGHVRYEGFSDEAVAELEAHGISTDLLNKWSGTYAVADSVELELVTIEAHFAALSSASAALAATYPNWSGPEAYAVVDQIHTLLNVLKNLSGCARAALGEGVVESWTDSLHEVLERLVFNLVELNLFPDASPTPQPFAPIALSAPPPPSSSAPATQATVAYQQLVDFALRSAVIGAGAIDQVAADDAEQALIDAGSRLLAELDAAGGSDDDRRRVLLTGALMGWEFTLDGTALNATTALADLGLSS